MTARRPLLRALDERLGLLLAYLTPGTGRLGSK